MKKNTYITKKIMSAILATLTAITGFMFLPEELNAAVVEDKVIYVNEEQYNINNYWSANATVRKSPIKAGYVFGGWFAQASETTEGAEMFVKGDVTTYYRALTASELNTDEDNDCDYTGTAYAKFVPAQVLSVKAQNKAETYENTAKTDVRLISSTDSKNYDKVGFDIWVNNKKQILKADGNALETDIIYDGLLVNEEPIYANAIFGGTSQYLSVWQLSNINKANYSKIIYVRPYWITKDGTKVEGIAKYVHIEDQYKGLISVPVNLLSGEQIAAGKLQLTYDVNGLEVYGCEEGRLLPSMRFYHDSENKTIRMVGNATVVDSNVSADGIYANIRFKKPNTDTNFTINSLEFGNWAEQLIEIDKVWDIKYVQQNWENQ